MFSFYLEDLRQHCSASCDKNMKVNLQSVFSCYSLTEGFASRERDRNIRPHAKGVNLFCVDLYSK